MRKKSGKKSISTIILLIILLVGLSVMLYPIIADWWNSKTQSKAIAAYQQKVSELNEEDYERIFAAAHSYNEELAKISNPLLNYDEVPDYENILDITGTGIMGYISIPQIRVELPIYHGTSEGVLNVAVGHMQGSSLPVGGKTTHAVISAHRGLPSAKLFSDLDKLAAGDTFTITVLNETFTYEVEEIFIVLPDDTENLAIYTDKDYVTLTTCTPYGINSHRLLLRAHRTENALVDENADVKVTADAVQLDSFTVVPFVAVPLFIILIAVWFFGGKKKKFPHSDPLSALEDNKQNNENNNELNSDK